MPSLKILCANGPGPKGFVETWRDAWQAEKCDDDVHPIFIDDTQGVVGNGFAKSSLLRKSHGYQPIITLSSFASHEHAQAEDLNLQSAVLREVLLGIPRISDNRLFVIRTKLIGSPVFLEMETKRLNATVLLLHSISTRLQSSPSISSSVVQRDSSSSSSSSPPTSSAASVASSLPKSYKLFRYENIELHFKTPKMEAPEIVQKHSVWGPPKLIENEKDIYSGSLLLAGESIDYHADLEELLLLRLSEVSSLEKGLNSKNARRALKLLSVLETSGSFLKIFDRDFKSLFGVEEEKESQSEVERALDTLISSLRPVPVTIKREREGDEMGEVMRASKAGRDEGSGRGRGISLLPAWMTNKETSAEPGLEGIVPSQPTEETAKTADVDALSINASTAPRSGRGRGVNLQPAWMTADPSQEPALSGSLLMGAEDTSDVYSQPLQALSENKLEVIIEL